MRISKQFWQGFVRTSLWALFVILRRVPWEPALAGGTAMGTLAYHLSARYRNVADKNLKIAYGASLTEHQRQGLIKRVFQHFTRAMLVEFLKGSDMTLAEIQDRVKLDSMEPLEAAEARGKGVIIIAAHLGNWEWSAKYLALEGHPLMLIARQSEDEKFNALTDRIRGNDGNTIHPRGESPRALLKTLRENGRIAIVPDQKSEDVFVPFFGKLAGTVAGPAVLALKTGATLLPLFCPRQPDGTYKIVFYPPIIAESTGNRDADILRIMTQLTAYIEDIVRQYPDQWLWLHDRWRVPPPAGLEARERSEDVPNPAAAH